MRCNSQNVKIVDHIIINVGRKKMISKKNLIRGIGIGILLTVCQIFHLHLLEKYDPKGKYPLQKHILILPNMRGM